MLGLKNIFSNVTLKRLLLHEGRIHVVCIGAGIACLLGMGIPVATGRFINSMISHHAVFVSFSFLVTLALSSLLADFLVKRSAIRFARRFELALQYNLLTILGDCNPGCLNRMGCGELSAKFLRDATILSMIVKELASIVTFACIGVLSSLIIVFSKNIIVGIVFCLAMPVCLAVVYPFGRKIKDVNHAYRKENDKAMNRVYVFIEKWSYLKALSATQSVGGKLNANFSALNHSGETQDKTYLHFDFLIRTMLFLGEYGVLLVCALLAWRGDIRVGDMIMFQMLFMQALGSFAGLFHAMPWLGMIHEADVSIRELTHAEALEKDEGKYVLKNFAGHIQLSHVSYQYPHSSTFAVENFSYTFVPGKCYVITGANGAGKTTLTKLLTTYAEPTRGEVFFDGYEVKTLNRSELRNSISILFQDSVLLAGSLRENITLGQAYASQEIDRVVTICGLCALVGKLPQGLDTELGEGVSLSGGECQRVALARALIRKPRIAVFDEISNHLDMEGVRALASILGELKRTCCVILVSHDKDMIDLADHVVEFAHCVKKDKNN